MSAKRRGNLKLLLAAGLVVCAAFAWIWRGGDAIARLQARAGGGDPVAQRQLGMVYAEGKRLPLDKQMALSWFTKAAEQGDAEAQFHLAEIYELGRGVKADYEKSFHWFLESAKRGFAEAQTSLGMAYQLGEGVERDYVEAYKWLQLAIEHGDTNAVISLSDLKVAMQPAEIVEGKKRAEIYAKAGSPVKR